MTKESMLDKLENISGIIWDHYNELTNLEVEGKKDTPEYEKVIEELKLILEIEDDYYRDLENMGIDAYEMGNFILNEYEKENFSVGFHCIFSYNKDRILDRMISKLYNYKSDSYAFSRIYNYNEFCSELEKNYELDLLNIFLSLINDLINDNYYKVYRGHLMGLKYILAYLCEPLEKELIVKKYDMKTFNMEHAKTFLEINDELENEEMLSIEFFREIINNELQIILKIPDESYINENAIFPSLVKRKLVEAALMYLPEENIGLVEEYLIKQEKKHADYFEKNSISLQLIRETIDDAKISKANFNDEEEKKYLYNENYQQLLKIIKIEAKLVLDLSEAEILKQNELIEIIKNKLELCYEVEDSILKKLSISQDEMSNILEEYAFNEEGEERLYTHALFTDNSIETLIKLKINSVMYNLSSESKFSSNKYGLSEEDTKKLMIGRYINHDILYVFIKMFNKCKNNYGPYINNELIYLTNKINFMNRCNINNNLINLPVDNFMSQLFGMRKRKFQSMMDHYCLELLLEQTDNLLTLSAKNMDEYKRNASFVKHQLLIRALLTFLSDEKTKEYMSIIDKEVNVPLHLLFQDRNREAKILLKNAINCYPNDCENYRVLAKNK